MLRVKKHLVALHKSIEYDMRNRTGEVKWGISLEIAKSLVGALSEEKSLGNV